MAPHLFWTEPNEDHSTKHVVRVCMISMAGYHCFVQDLGFFEITLLMECLRLQDKFRQCSICQNVLGCWLLCACPDRSLPVDDPKLAVVTSPQRFTCPARTRPQQCMIVSHNF